MEIYDSTNMSGELNKQIERMRKDIMKDLSKIPDGSLFKDFLTSFFKIINLFPIEYRKVEHYGSIDIDGFRLQFEIGINDHETNGVYLIVEYEDGKYLGSFSIYEIIALALELSYSSKELAYKTLQFTWPMVKYLQNDTTFNKLYDATMITMVAWERNDEFSLQEKFKKNVSILIPGAKIVERKMIPGHYPDAFVKVNGQICPVEVKLTIFNKAALEQLKRYMRMYKTEIGYAVAPKLTVPLPKNIIFIQLNL